MEGSRSPGPIPEPIVLFDGACGLCGRTVAWLLAKDRDRRLRFAPLQGETAARLRALHPGIPEDVSTVVLVEGGRVHLRSRALLHVARHLGPPWRWASWLRFLPAAVLDPPYRLVARIRHRLGGRARVRTPEDPRVLP